MSECYILETDIFIEREFEMDLTDPANPVATDNIISYGFKDAATVAPNGPFGGMSKQVVRTGDVPTEAHVFSLKCGTAWNVDANEGLKINFVETIDPLGADSTPFELIYLELPNFDHYNNESSVDDIILGLIGGAYVPLLATSGDVQADNGRILAWFRDNLNNTPHIKLKCYPTAP